MRVLRAAKAAGVERFVQISSTVAVQYGHPQAERAARDFVQKHGSGLHYGSVNPGFVLGPALDADVGASAQVIEMFLRGNTQVHRECPSPVSTSEMWRECTASRFIPATEAAAAMAQSLIDLDVV
jgi:nucleoside-diphosphate-sugar epimerase